MKANIMRYHGLTSEEITSLQDLFAGKSILITGGTGSFGKRLVKRLVEITAPRRIIIFSRDELKQYEMRQEFQTYDDMMRYFIGDVRDGQRLDTAFRDIDYIIHAAALKHVPIGEYNPMEMVKTNIHGAEHVIHSAIRNQVKKIIALSTDKACNPCNLYGATKLASDKLFVAGNNLVGDQETRFSVVRYGNVVGSRGSVIPFFAKLLQNKADYLPITHQDMTRFVITLEQGVDFVLSHFLDMQGGEIWVPKIPSINIMALAQAMAPQMPTKIIGIRPGEKLHEMMISQEDGRNSFDLKSHYVIAPMISEWQYSAPNDKQQVVSDFQYDSGNNDDWLSEDELYHLIEPYLQHSQ
jgi:UDP-N-acetylglucosamine 4,6-dehydratase